MATSIRYVDRLNVVNTLTSTSPTTGAFTCAGGAGIAEKLNVGGTTNNFSATTASTSTSTGTIITAGGVGIAKQLNAGGDSTFVSGTASTTTNTGAVVVTGGVGVSGAINLGAGLNGADTLGDVLVGNGTTVTALGIGTATQVLTVVGGTAAWADASGGLTSATLQTTDATPTTIQTVALSTDLTTLIDVRVSAGNDTTAAIADTGSWFVKASFFCDGVGATQIAVTDQLSFRGADALTADWDVTFATSGTDALIQVTGEAATTINWRSSYFSLESPV